MLLTPIHFKLISEKLGIQATQIQKTHELFDSGHTLPFISRYRKEATGGLDEVQLGEIKKELERFSKMEERKEFIIQTLATAEKLTPELRSQIEHCRDEKELEDIYLPYKVKRKTRASAAREKGLEPLAEGLLKGAYRDPEAEAEKYGMKAGISAEEALEGASDILAEKMSEHAEIRKYMRKLYSHEGVLKAKKAKKPGEDAEKFRDYFDYSEAVKKMPAHRILAVFRGENESVLNLSVEVDEEKAFQTIIRNLRLPFGACGIWVEKAFRDGFKRLLAPSLENEIKADLKEKADKESIKVFGENLSQLLMAPPLGNMRVMAIDPGFRTGCKVVCLNEMGALLHNETIYPHAPQNEKDKAAKTLRRLTEVYKIKAIAIGNGTAGRETEEFIKNKVLFPAESDVKVFSVNESGASIYSASSVAREEFPNYDVTVRGAVSIGRRLMDPLAELVKIDPKSVGVGQYQHDVDQHLLKTELEQIVENCVNRVGVELNMASKHILTHISGLGPVLAQNIVDYRTEHGPFTSRKELLKVPKLGPKAFELSAGFLRIRDAKNPLDNSAVHPERYALVEKMAADLGLKTENLIRNPEAVNQIIDARYVSDEVGLPTIQDIKNELLKPGRDPRSTYKILEFNSDIRSISDLIPGMILPGIVTNITNFGCFVDVGVKQDGLVHISQIADRFISDPAQAVKLHQHVKVKVLEADAERKRISFSMKGLN
ncbi:MAG: RNA-binding transcriptional accessory protein [Flavobacteriales bacterium]|nr:RNA-binding transcriptional accessory protein [Flavobacteriales bacterium]